MNVEILELNDLGMPGESQRFALAVLPRVGELVAFGDRFFEVLNIIHKIDANAQSAALFVRSTKAPYQEPRSRFGFGGR